jgi:hypothetical protein
MKRFLKRIAITVSSLWLMFQSAAIAVEPEIPNPAALFKPNLIELQMTGIPLRLPNYIPEIGQRLKDDNSSNQRLSVYVHLDEATANRYEITIGHSPTCTGGNVCRLGTIAATRITKGTPSIAEQYAFMKDPKFLGRRSKEPISSVKLNQNLTGTFIPWVCGANCNDAKVVWDEGQYRYSVGIKVGDRDSLIQMANSSILSKP